MTSATPPAAPPPQAGPTPYFIVVRAFPPGAVVWRPMASDKGNIGAIGLVNEPIWVHSEDPSEEEWQIGGNNTIHGENGQSNYSPANYHGYMPTLQPVKLQPPQGVLHPWDSTQGGPSGCQYVRYVPEIGKPELELLPAPGMQNWFLRQTFAMQYHWIVSTGAALLAFAALLAYLSQRPKILAQRAIRQREMELNKRFETFDPDSDRFLNREFGRWRTVERLGQGGMATVYRAVPKESLNDDESVALKVMNPELMRDADYRRRFEREIEISRTLDHPHVVRPVDWGQRQGILYLVMEYVQGKPLRDLMHPKRGFPIVKALQLARDITSGLLYAHNKGIVHRDLKPENVMVTDRGLVKLMDLGLAKRNESDTVTKTGDTFGTPAYMAPEQIAGGGGLLPATDQYAMGIIIFELVLGMRPFLAEDTLSLVLMHLNEPPPRVRTVAPQLPQDLDDLINKMLAKDPSQRYANMGEVKAILDQISEKYQ